MLSKSLVGFCEQIALYKTNRFWMSRECGFMQSTFTKDDSLSIWCSVAHKTLIIHKKYCLNFTILSDMNPPTSPHQTKQKKNHFHNLLDFYRGMSLKRYMTEKINTGIILMLNNMENNKTWMWLSTHNAVVSMVMRYRTWLCESHRNAFEKSGYSLFSQQKPPFTFHVSEFGGYTPISCYWQRAFSVFQCPILLASLQQTEKKALWNTNKLRKKYQ